MRKAIKKSFGFTILEVAAVLGIIGVVAGGATMLLTEQQNLAVEKESKAKLIMVKKAIVQFTKDNKYMPCPDIDNDGFEDRVAANGTIPAITAVTQANITNRNQFAPTLPAREQVTAQAAINGVAVNVCAAASGQVPFNTLDLSKVNTEDSDANPFIYEVDGGVISANNMLNCPIDSACFFNSAPAPVLGAGLRMPFQSLPAFDANTEPNVINLGANNLTICLDNTCADILQNGLLAVVLATNAADHPITADELENLDANGVYVDRPVTKGGDEYNDMIIGISANEVRQRRMPAVAEFEVAPVSNNRPRRLAGDDVGSLGDSTVGVTGTNLGTDPGDLESITQQFDFGLENAGKKISLTFDTHAVGGWDKAATTSAGVFDDRGAVYYGSTTDSTDQTKLREFDYDHLADAWDVNKLEQVTFTSAINGRYSDVYNADGSWDNRVFTRGQQITTWQPTWDESHEYFVTLDETGKVDITFEVETTATVETIDFTNIQLGLFDTPPDPPSFPTVAPVSGITQTEGLNDDKDIRFDVEGEESEGNVVVTPTPGG